MRPVHASGWMKRRMDIIRLRRNDQSFILPVVQISGSIASYTPVPDSASRYCFFFIFTVPVINSVNKDLGSTVSLYSFSFCIQPNPSRIKSIIFIHLDLLSCLLLFGVLSGPLLLRILSFFFSLRLYKIYPVSS